MECTVRYVHEVNLKGKQIGGVKPALCFRGTDKAHAVINDDNAVRVVEIPLPIHDKSSPVLYHGEPYDPKPYADRLLMSAKAASKPVTRRARTLLQLRDAAIEAELPLEETEPQEQVKVYADNSPKERIKDAKRPSPVTDITEDFKKSLAELNRKTDAELTKTLGPRGSEKPARKGANGKAAPVSRIDVEKAHNAAREAIAKPNGKAKPTLPHADRGKLVKKLADEFKLTPFDLRVIIRSTGMRAPYEDEKAIRKAVKGKLPATK